MYTVIDRGWLIPLGGRKDSAWSVMEFFLKAKSVRLRSHHEKYLLADDDKESVCQDRKGSVRQAKWEVELVPGYDHVTRLKSCYGKYLTATNVPFLLCMTGKKVQQTLPKRLDSFVEWEPQREGVQVTEKLMIELDHSQNVLCREYWNRNRRQNQNQNQGLKLWLLIWVSGKVENEIREFPMCEWGLAAVEELDHARPDAPAQAHREGLDLVGGRRGGASARTSSSSSATAAGRRAGAQQLGRGRGRGRGTGLSIRYLPYMATYLQERGFLSFSSSMNILGHPSSCSSSSSFRCAVWTLFFGLLGESEEAGVVQSRWQERGVHGGGGGNHHVQRQWIGGAGGDAGGGDRARRYHRLFPLGRKALSPPAAAPAEQRPDARRHRSAVLKR